MYLCVDVSNQSNPMLTSVSGDFDIFVSFSKPSISRISQFWMNSVLVDRVETVDNSE